MSDVKRTTFVVEERPHEYAGVHADRVRIEGGALVFENGDLFNSELVLIQAPGTWLSVHTQDEDEDCTCEEEEGA